jgi:hypothetical protein
MYAEDVEGAERRGGVRVGLWRRRCPRPVMRVEVMWPLLLVAAVINAPAQPPLDCPRNARVTDAIAALGRTRSATPDQLSILASDPDTAACHLLGSLHVVRDTHIAGYQQAKHASTMRVIWALRALRFLTDCQDFCAPTRENPAAWEPLRREWLLRDDAGAPVENWHAADGVRFFATWMSRDSVFIAPPDAQQKIIVQWLHWYRDAGRRGFHFHPCDSERWYF